MLAGIAGLIANLFRQATSLGCCIPTFDFTTFPSFLSRLGI